MDTQRTAKCVQSDEVEYIPAHLVIVHYFLEVFLGHQRLELRLASAASQQSVTPD